MSHTVFHICLQQDWDHARLEGRYAPPSLETQGFIHASTREQILPSAERFFAHTREPLVLLAIKTADLATGVLRWEAPAEAPLSSARFPHLYAPLSPLQVTAWWPLTRNTHGQFGLPEPMS